ncbi:MAG TPA: glycosyltransferase family 9 protein [Ignavibacteriaceae bacterium]|nr:glycosyltransferase family 9 protein [Ignavibacteriaceae bacterium]
MEINKDKVGKILIIKLKGIGDVVLSTIVLDNLIKDFPNAKIDYLTENPSLPLLQKNSSVNNVHVFRNEGTFSGLNLIRKIATERYDLIFDFYSNPRTALITFLSGAKYRAGFPYRGRKYAYNLFGPEERGKFHAAQLHLELLKMIGLSVSHNNLHAGIDENDTKFASDFFCKNFDSDDFVVGISPSGGWDSKKYPPEKFVELLNSLSAIYNVKFLILWGPGDAEDAEIIFNSTKNKSAIAPKSTIRQMAALIQKCKVLIANDSGPMHISTAVGTPTLSIHGPTSPQLQGPYGEKHEWVRLDELECIECNLLKCPKNQECFFLLPIQKIIDKFELLIQKNKLTPVKI